jgi:hypothetical protein
MSHPNLTTKIHNSSGYAGGAAQITQANASNDKSCPNSITNINSYLGGASQIPKANDINDKSHPNSTMNTHSSSCYLGSAAQVPQANAINDKSHPNLTTHITIRQVMPEALPKFHRQMILMTSLIPI